MKLTKLFLSLASISALVMISDSAVLAGSSTANLPVSATVVKACSIRTSAVAFGNYDPSASAANDAGVGAVIIRCTPNTATTIGLGFGQNSGGTVQRSMKEATSGSGNLLQYGLFSDAGRTTAWGDGTLSSVVFTPPTKTDNAEYTYSVYGRIPALQNVPDYTYNDIVLATVNF